VEATHLLFTAALESQRTASVVSLPARPR